MTPRTSGPRTAIVTGAAGGIGRATALRLSRDGCTVVLVDLDLTSLDVVAKELDGRALCVAADVSSAEDWDRIVDVAQRETGRLDILVNNAGIEGPITSMESYPEDAFRRVLEVNVVGVFLGMKACSKALRASGDGAIVNVASVSGLGGQPSIIAYVASKHAVLGMTKAAALEFAADGVRVNAVCPSPVDTDMVQRLAESLSPNDPESVHRRLRAAAPLGRYATAEEVAGSISFLCGPDAAYLTGVGLPVDGGSRAH
jgi:NAD(P)-dependent dehydrogenase (short-subunit alcohol dehydrogenase family)